MADNTKIEWTDATWNPITGCSVHSPGCTNCYAMKLAGTRLKHVASRKGLTRETKAGPVWTGEVRFNEVELLKPLSWRRPRMIFVCAHGDLFHENVPDEWIDRVFAVMALCPQHTFQVLTKRSGRMREYLNGEGIVGGPAGRSVRIWSAADSIACDRRLTEAHPSADYLQRGADGAWPLPNAWLGVSVEDQARADERVPDLLAAPAAERWLSCEPLLGLVDLTGLRMQTSDILGFDAMAGKAIHKDDGDLRTASTKLDWIVAGGESGPGARPMHPDWARALRDQCAAAAVPFFFKQWGEYAPCELGVAGWRGNLSVVLPDGRHLRGADCLTVAPECPTAEIIGHFGKGLAGRHLDGQLHDAMPAIGGT